MSKLIMKSLGDGPLPTEMNKVQASLSCSECAETAELPLKLKLGLPLESTPNVVVPLDVVLHKIHEST